MRTSYHVAPRYTAGSPASVRQEIAETVAEEEASAYARYLTGRYGEEEMKRAMTMGLNGIAEEVTHYANYNLARDLLTGELRDSRQNRKYFNSTETQLIKALEAIIEMADKANQSGKIEVIGTRTYVIDNAREVLKRVWSVKPSGV